MPTKEQLRSRLMKKLQELFQLNQPDLDFGFYRIMHAKAKQVQEFIDKDLLQIVEDAFGQGDEARKLVLKAKVEEAIAQAKNFGAPDPEGTPAVKEARSKYSAALDTAAAEADVYDHLYRFFERYYDDGDFISRRYSARETPGKAAPFAVPYNGEEVKLHWANADQYYIKTTEYFSNYTFDLKKTQEIRALREQPQLGLKWNAGDDTPLKVHFRILGATEGEHGNVKESEADKRYFLIHTDKPIDINETGELVINFEYRPDPEKTGQEGVWRDKRNAEAVNTALARLEEMGKTDAKATEYLHLLNTPAPTESDKKRPLLAKYINQYTARNTMDYFVHKDLGGFLRRELDFYIKNEVMRLDDIENAEAPDVESYLAKLKVLRKIGGKLIDFLAQLEDFQKKLWLKKKFVIETNYCITLDSVPEELYSEIAANPAQHDEWVKLFAIDKIVQPDNDAKKSGTLSYSQPLTLAFLKANNKLVLDTRFFDEAFKAKLLASIDNFDEKSDGLLIHSENFQALNLLQCRYKDQVKCIYVDPPYNTAATEILYKNEYKHSSWCSLMFDRMAISTNILNGKGIFEIAIDNVEFHRLEAITRVIFGDQNYITNIAIMNNPKGRDQEHFADCHDYTIVTSKDSRYAETFRLKLSEGEITKKYSKGNIDTRYRELPLRRSGSGAQRENRQYMYFPFIYNKKNDVLCVIPKEEYQKIFDGTKFNDDYVNELREKYEKNHYTFILPIRDDGSLGRWRWGYDTCLKGCNNKVLFVKNDKKPTVYQIDDANDSYLPKTLWFGERYDASTKGTNLLKDIVGKNDFDYPKSLFTVKDMLAIGSLDESTILDFFAGSGTTGHAVVDLNREDKQKEEDSGHRKYILVEIADHFDTVLKPRIVKVVYSKDWKDGKPTARNTGISQCFKYLRLESYEDTLNNLEFGENLSRIEAVGANATLKEDFMLHYLLDVETRGSQSLLNINCFSDPTVYKLKIKKSGSDEYAEKNIDLIETFNYLIGLRVNHTAVSQTLNADFKRIPDPELPDDQHTRLVVKGNIRQDADGPWWFRKVEGWVPKDTNTSDGAHEKVLIVWRKLTGDQEKDNLMLDEWFKKNRISTTDFEFTTIYVNGSNNLPNLAQPGDNWKVRLIEEEFMKRMWDMEKA
ncbi:site-specific DNA-methyltransferase [Dehalococcoides mccartyi]|uniref:site-specific DNA-methyltransferase n=1 Tax=Dehalococcoides mccartyi TaxID=61435 RepID=UPI0007506D81|nr:DNA methyltransferase [Dehalococcoides mccartyi]